MAAGRRIPGDAAAASARAAAESVIVALDVATAEEADALLARLDGAVRTVKVGMQLFYAAGPAYIASLKARGLAVFLDLKGHDIPNTVKGAMESLTRLGVDMVTVHAAGGRAMLEAARAGVERALTPGQRRPLLLAVTVLTSIDARTLNEEIGVPGGVEEAVLRYALLAREAGCDGVVASAREVPAVKASCGPAFVAVTPGIRPAGAARGDQARAVTPADAIRRGADFLVVGRPVTAAPDPRAAYERVVAEVAGALENREAGIAVQGAERADGGERQGRASRRHARGNGA
ncbi:orotidine-5'-phosphate decarboxylase [Calditerricola satsumensis]|nr:orotidine-5'-phosphate decarboxylase [Calditerricola satsumensis]